MSAQKMKAQAPAAVHADVDRLDAEVNKQCGGDTAKMSSVWDILNQLRKQYSVPWGQFIQFAIKEIPIIISLMASGATIDVVLSKVVADLLAFLFPPAPLASIPA